MKRPPSLPKSIRRWRGRRWKAIIRAETVVGHSLHLTQQIQKKLNEVQLLKQQKRLTPDRLRATAREVLLAVSELADEILEAGLSRKTARQPYTQVYLNTLKHFWASFPPELQQEIIRQSKEK